jgi:hypothetical protein
MSRAFGPNITINAWNLSRRSDREQYEMEVALILAVDLLNGSQVGRAVIEAIWGVHGRHLRIQPWTGRAEDAETVPLDWHDATNPGEPLRDSRGQRRPGGGFGNGRGSSTVVRFSPRRHVFDLSRMFAGARRARIQFDRAEVLLHELCHALRVLLGRLRLRSMPNHLENEEEFFAVLVADIYSSEKGRPLLADHGVRELTHPNQWLSGPVFPARVQFFRQQMPEFTRRLAQVETPFNPFRDAPAP